MKGSRQKQVAVSCHTVSGKKYQAARGRFQAGDMRKCQVINYSVRYLTLLLIPLITLLGTNF